MTKLYRQGDILLKELPSRPKGKRPLKSDGVLAEGETTGHMHRVEDMTKAEVYEIDGKLMLSTKTGVRIIHEEHNPITLPKGNYQVVRQRESTGVGGRTRMVGD